MPMSRKAEQIAPAGTSPRQGASRDIRCPGCGALLARVEGGGICIRRGGLQATFTGDVHAALVCYQPGCRRLTVVATTSPGRAAAGRGPESI